MEGLIDKVTFEKEVRRAMQILVEGFLDSEINNAETLRALLRTSREGCVAGSERTGKRDENEVRETGDRASVKVILAGYCGDLSLHLSETDRDRRSEESSVQSCDLI